MRIIKTREMRLEFGGEYCRKDIT